MTVYGESSTLSATMDSMVRHARAVSRAAKRALVVGDMPFLSYQAGEKEAVLSAGRFLAQGGCSAVKVEGGRRVLSAVSAILAADIPVMGHVGLTPQSYRKLGGFKVQGREEDSAHEILEDAKALALAGCFAVVLECVPDTLAAEITREIPVPTIGIGAGAACDGQVLVFHDVMGITTDLSPRFVRRYANLSKTIEEAARAFAKDVKSGAFPSAEESFQGAKAPALRRVY
jgi:3-methyl-2-oxobutanoate hydroxymethyltransferase